MITCLLRCLKTFRPTVTTTQWSCHSVARWSIGNFWRFGVKISVETKKNREIRIFITVFCGAGNWQLMIENIFKWSEWSDRKEEGKWREEERGKTGQCQFIKLFFSAFYQLYFNYMYTILNSSKMIRWLTSINLSLNLYCLLIYNMLSNVPRASS